VTAPERAYALAYARGCVHAYIRACVCVSVRACVRARACACARAYILSYIDVYIYKYACVAVNDLHDLYDIICICICARARARKTNCSFPTPAAKWRGVDCASPQGRLTTSKGVRATTHFMSHAGAGRCETWDSAVPPTPRCEAPSGEAMTSTCFHNN